MNLQDYFPCHAERPPGADSFDVQQLPAGGGVYALVDEHGRLIQLATAENLRRVLGGRLDPVVSEERRARADVASITRQVWWEPTHSRFETTLRFLHTAYGLVPGQYRKLCSFGPAWFAVLDLRERFPRWQVRSDPFCGASACVGPFAARPPCAAFVQDLEELFALCRYHHILEQTPHGEACSYFEMGRCPAPCDGTIPWQQYRDMLSDSVAALLGDGAALLERIRRDMATASEELEFERAQRHKQDLARAEKSTERWGRLRRRLEDWRYLIVQRGGGRTRFKAYFFNQGEIEESAVVRDRDLPDVVAGWAARVSDMTTPQIEDRTLAAERVWLLSFFLRKQAQLPGAYIHVSGLGEAEALVGRIRKSFEPRRQAGPGMRTRST